MGSVDGFEDVLRVSAIMICHLGELLPCMVSKWPRHVFQMSMRPNKMTARQIAETRHLYHPWCPKRGLFHGPMSHLWWIKGNFWNHSSCTVSRGRNISGSVLTYVPLKNKDGGLIWFSPTEISMATMAFRRIYYSLYVPVLTFVVTTWSCVIVLFIWLVEMLSFVWIVDSKSPSVAVFKNRLNACWETIFRSDETQ